MRINGLSSFARSAHDDVPATHRSRRPTSSSKSSIRDLQPPSASLSGLVLLLSSSPNSHASPCAPRPISITAAPRDGCPAPAAPSPAPAPSPDTDTAACCLSPSNTSSKSGRGNRSVAATPLSCASRSPLECIPEKRCTDPVPRQREQTRTGSNETRYPLFGRRTAGTRGRTSGISNQVCEINVGISGVHIGAAEKNIREEQLVHRPAFRCAVNHLPKEHNEKPASSKWKAIDR